MDADDAAEVRELAADALPVPPRAEEAVEDEKGLPLTAPVLVGELDDVHAHAPGRAGAVWPKRTFLASSLIDVSVFTSLARA
jgi:hypothetical protein